MFTLRLPWEELLPGKFRRPKYRHALESLLHVVMTAGAHRKLRKGGYAAIPHETIVGLLGDRSGRWALATAQAMELIQCDGAGKPGRTCHGYRLNALALSYGVAVKRMPLALEQRQARARRRADRVLKSAQRLMLQTLRGVRVSHSMWPAFGQRLTGASLVSAICSVYAVESVRRGQWWFAADDETGRVFNNVTNFPSDLRPHLMLDGQPVGELDIASSQPYFLAALAYQGDNSDEAQRFRALVTSERFYESMGELAGLTGVSRDRIKTRFLVEVLFGENRYRDNPRAKLWAAIVRHFPKLAAFVEESKRCDYATLACQLQRAEADAVVGCVVPALQAQGMAVLSIHDGLLVQREHTTAALSVMVDELMAATGIRPLVRLKSVRETAAEVLAA